MISTLFAFCLVLLAIAAIARYNESNKLFWTLLVPFLVGFAVLTMFHKKSSVKQEEKVVMQQNPTQVAALAPDAFMYLLIGDSSKAPKKETSKPASQDSVAISNAPDSSSEIAIKTRDQPLDNIVHDTS